MTGPLSAPGTGDRDTQLYRTILTCPVETPHLNRRYPMSPGLRTDKSREQPKPVDYTTIFRAMK